MISNTSIVDYLSNRLSEDPMIYYKSGFTTFDEMTFGIFAGMNVLIQASSGEGKTQFLTALLMNLATNNPDVNFLFINSEMSSDFIQIAKIAYLNKIKQKRVHDLDFELNEIDVNKDLLNIYTSDYDVNNKEFWQITFKKASELGIKVIVYDYLGCFQFGNETWNKIREEMQSIKLLSKQYNIAIITAQQLNTNAKTLDKHNLPSEINNFYTAGSTQAMQFIDVALTLIQLDYHNNTYDYRIDLYKGRQGQIKQTKYFKFNIDILNLIDDSSVEKKYSKKLDNILKKI